MALAVIFDYHQGTRVGRSVNFESTDGITLRLPAFVLAGVANRCKASANTAEIPVATKENTVASIASNTKQSQVNQDEVVLFATTDILGTCLRLTRDSTTFTRSQNEFRNVSPH